MNPVPTVIPAGLPIVYLKEGSKDPGFKGEGWYGFDELCKLCCGPHDNAIEVAYLMGQRNGDEEGTQVDQIEEVVYKMVKKWGEKEVEQLAIGEVGEMLALFGRRALHRTITDDWVEAVASVLIMAHALAQLHGKEAIATRIDQKLGKLRIQIENGSTRYRKGEA